MTKWERRPGVDSIMQSFVLIQTTVAAAEELSAALWEQAGILGIEELPADGGDLFAVDTAHQFVRFDDRARYEAWLRTEAFRSGDAILLKVYLAEGTSLPAKFTIIGRGTVEPRDYLATMRAQHHGRLIGKFWVGPPWETPPAGLVPVIVEPGMAFGLGDHPTTQMCLELLAGLSRNNAMDDTPHPVTTPQTIRLRQPAGYGGQAVALGPASPRWGEARRTGR